jgi:xanthine dehydrogenase small subunit
MGRVQTGFEFVLNDQSVRVEHLAPQTTLLDYIRNRGLTGAKEGCAEGECGACAVLFVRGNGAGSRYIPVNSCLVPLPVVVGQEILTVEALASGGEMSEVQRAMAAGGGSQCGYCTPGFVVSMFAEYYRREQRPADAESLNGNLCRCTGYRPIRDALMSLGAPPEGPRLERLRRPAPRPVPVVYATNLGKFSRPETLDECFEILETDPAARLVAGNTDLGVMTNLHGERFDHLVSIENIAELRSFRDTADAVEIGAGLTLSEIGERWSEAPAVVHDWLRLFASVLIRNRATLGGNLATASPIGDSAPLLLAFDAEVEIASSTGRRRVPLAAFFTGYRRTLLGREEILISIGVPKPFPDETRFYKIAKRSCDDISSVTAGMSLRRGRTGRITRARLAFGGVAPTPVRAIDAENELIGTMGDEEDFDGARRAVLRSLSPISDHRGSADYRSAIVQSLLEKFRVELTGERVAG